MIGIYFSGTGNTEYCVKKFFERYDPKAEIYSIENPISIEKIQQNREILFAYPIQFSTLPKIVRDYISDNAEIWKGKKMFILSTMGLFSGDGSGLSARLFKKYGATIIGGVHLQMPDSISDERALKRSLEKNRKIINNSILKAQRAADSIKSNSPMREGLGICSHIVGLLGQRLYYSYKTKEYSNKLKIDPLKCIGCGKCAINCPMKNIILEKRKAYAKGYCTMCYRCISYCPTQAITLLGSHIIEQAGIEKYIDK